MLTIRFSSSFTLYFPGEIVTGRHLCARRALSVAVSAIESQHDAE